MELLARYLWPMFQGIHLDTDKTYLALPCLQGRELQCHFYELPQQRAPLLIGQANWEETPLWEEAKLPTLELSVAAKAWLAQKSGASASHRRLSILPLSLGGFSQAFVLTPAPTPGQPFSTLLLSLHKRLSAQFTAGRLQQLDHPHQFTQAFFESLCQLLMPAAYKSPGQSVWVPFCRQLYPTPANYEYVLDFGASTGALKACSTGNRQNEHLQEEIESLYRDLYEKWELCNRKELLVANRIQRLSDELEANRSVLNSLMASQQNQLQELGSLKRLAEQLSAPGAASSFEFFQGTDRWTIRFDGKPVKMGNRYTLGLIYIHQLLMNPGKEIHCHQLYLRSGKDLRQSSTIWQEIEGQFGKKALADDEKSWLDSIARIEARLKGASLEIALPLLEYRVFLAEQLYRTHASRANLANLAESRSRLKAKRLEAEPGQLDERFYKKDLTLRSALYKESGREKEHRRMYQNVTKAIHRTIKTMSLPEARTFFQQTLSIGMRCCYLPEKAGIEPPNWKFWMD